MASESVRSRLAFNLSAFQQLEEREAALLLAEERARAALQSAQDALDVVRTELQDVRGRRAGVASTIGELRGYLGARLLQSLPAEVLYMIFSEAVDDPYARDDWMYQLPPAAVMPYTLAAVCRSWRHEAVRMARLWSFVVVPSPARCTRAVDYLSIMLERSQSAPLDVVLHWESCHWASFDRLQVCIQKVNFQGFS
ncbi:hypothetical protein AURDEDRAFT_176578 [Auricularia subglabra TFB-10046 SS5]|uniref:Uncharacterized protein n=1 Tax=Auricularia subglabra (strain TFB-10046 / SS5) TaxID=717982 RepID=J0WR19_AURST|nr:hypothetical protein AURDEDRAFT_176578 [Auricularia subglabra TFB-10046 SS5]